MKFWRNLSEDFAGEIYGITGCISSGTPQETPRKIARRVPVEIFLQKNLESMEKLLTKIHDELLKIFLETCPNRS